ncbi:MAG: PHB depolymerase family esterase [Undibacterium sp.]
MRPGMVIFAILLIVISLAVVHRHNKRAAERLTSSSLIGTAPSAQGIAPVRPGDYTLRSGEHEIAIGKRKYLLYIPKSYDASLPVPLVLFFHGGGGWMEQAAADYGWKEKSDKEGFAVAFPNGSSRLPRQRLATWNAGNCCGYARDQKIDDVGFVRQVVADIERQVNIDPKRIYATGMSNGGILSHRLACELADTFAAVASVAGTDGDTACKPARPISVMHIHAKDDDHVLFGGGAGEGSFRDESKVADFVSVDETVRRWIERNQADPTPVRILDVPGAYADRYTSKLNSSVIELVVTETGGHSWPGMKAVRGKKPSTAINADDTIWNFFQAHPKEGR